MAILVLYLDHGGGGGERSPVSQAIFQCRPSEIKKSAAKVVVNSLETILIINQYSQ